MGPPKKGTEISRAERKAKKRKLEEAIPDVPGDNDAAKQQILSGGEEKSTKKRKRDRDGVEADDSAKKTSKEERKEEKKRKSEEGNLNIDEQGEETKKEKKDKKRKKEAELEEPYNESIGRPETSELVAEEAEAPRKSKKERKAERKAREATNATNPSISETTPNVTKDTEPKEEKKAKKNNRNREKKRKAAGDNGTDAKSEGKAARFIVFVGNLPFSATTESIQKHFASVKPKSVRHLTQKDDPTKSKGAAFVEFDGYNHMETCLKLFHHSMFDDGVSPPRKINVELSAGGGGNSKYRRAKIEGKNQKLNGERSRRIQEEEKAKWARRGESIDESIHPSRRGLVPV